MTIAAEALTLKATTHEALAQHRESRAQKRLTALFAHAERLTSLDEAGRRIYRRLSLFRARLAEAEGVPAYRILSNRSLFELARSRPVTEEALADLKGIGTLLARAYGAEIIASVRLELTNNRG